MLEENPPFNPEKSKLGGKIQVIIADSLRICDIERDKIPPTLKTKLNEAINELTENMSILLPETPAVELKLSITKESIEILHTSVMREITKALGIDFGKLNVLSSVIFQIIEYEKHQRDKEASSI